MENVLTFFFPFHIFGQWIDYYRTSNIKHLTIILDCYAILYSKLFVGIDFIVKKKIRWKCFVYYSFYCLAAFIRENVVHSFTDWVHTARCNCTQKFVIKIYIHLFSVAYAKRQLSRSTIQSLKNHKQIRVWERERQRSLTVSVATVNCRPDRRDERI